MQEIEELRQACFDLAESKGIDVSGFSASGRETPYEQDSAITFQLPDTNINDRAGYFDLSEAGKNRNLASNARKSLY